jgi:hypothetical protein
MPNTPFNINHANNAWNCDPTSQTVPLSSGAEFSNNSSRKGCTVCFETSATFGVSSLDLAASESKTLPFAQGQNAGSGTGFGVHDSGYDCAAAHSTADAYPFDVTIGSGEGKKMKAKHKSHY